MTHPSIYVLNKALAGMVVCVAQEMRHDIQRRTYQPEVYVQSWSVFLGALLGHFTTIHHMRDTRSPQIFSEICM